MPAEKTRADSLWEYLTGASSDGGAQSDPDAALGNYRSSSEAQSMSVSIASPISNITIEFASGGNEIGDGTLNVVDADTLQWKCYGESYGASVAIANGETKIVETSGLPGGFLRVTRTSATALTGTATVTLSSRLNNVYALDDVSSDEATAGDTEYRATIIVNESVASIAAFKRWIGTFGTAQVSNTTQLGASGAGTIVTTGSFSDWPEQGWCHIKNGAATREIVYYSERTSTVLTVPATGRGLLGTTAAAGSATDDIHAVPGFAIAKDTDGITSGGAAIQTIGDEDTPPTSVSWSTGITAATGLDIGAMLSGEQIGIWIKREIPVSAIATTEASSLILDSFDAA